MLLVKSTPQRKLLPMLTLTLQGHLCCPGLDLCNLPAKGVHRCHGKHVALALKLLPTFYDMKKSNECLTSLLYSRKFSSTKNFVTSDRQAVCQEVIFVRWKSSLVCSSIVQSSLFLLIVYLTIHESIKNFFLIQHLWLLKNWSGIYLAKKLL